MKLNHYYRVPTSFGPDTHFDITPVAPVPFRAVQESAFDRLKSRLLADSLEELLESEFKSEMRQAANEAAALAWLTPYPLLMFPLLFEEKTRAALVRAARQERIRHHSRWLLAV